MTKQLHFNTHKKHVSKFVSMFLLLLAFSFTTNAQTLMHSYNFQGNANDGTGTANGTVNGSPVFTSEGLVLDDDGDYLSFVGTELDLNSFTAITMEYVFKGSTTANAGWTWTGYFGDDGGSNAFYTALSHWGPEFRSVYNSNALEVFNNSVNHNDGELHHIVTILTATDFYVYRDGVLLEQITNGAGSFTIGTAQAYLGKGSDAWGGDPTWQGTIQEFNIYDGLMDATTVATKADSFLGGTNANLATLTVSAGTLAPTFDASVTSYGISVPSGTASVDIYGTTDDTEASITSGTGTTTLTSGEGTMTIVVTAADGVTTKTYTISVQEECFTAYGASNLTPDPLGGDRSLYGGWGATSVTNDLTETYCGASSIKIGNGGTGCDAAFDINPAAFLLPETTYRVRAMVKTVDGNIGFRVSAGSFLFDSSIDTNGEWVQQDFTFTTDATATTDGFISFNKCDSGSTATYVYIDNYEIYNESALSLSEFELDNTAFSIYPNPSNGGSFKIALNSFEISNVKIFNVLGKQVLNKDFAANSNTVEVNHKLSSGVYIVKVNNNSTSKLIVE